MKQTYSGGCHCGAVRYEAAIDLAQGTLRCNCSICGKTRAWIVAIDGGAFNLVSGAEALTDYTFGSGRIHHLFCRYCGIKSFGRAANADGTQFVAVVVSCLENVPDIDLASLPVTYLDGRHDNFAAAPQETRHM